ncbi:MAG: DUF3786 domain-containing protein, partial [Oscillospiraceae bacterium]|nr:DUF3786 domain-containing protein [Oscillospiraceae bacterium]
MDITNNKEGRPLAHFSSVFAGLDAFEAARRCGAAFDGAAFELSLFGRAVRVSHPSASFEPDGPAASKSLLLRYLAEGRLTPFNGSFLAYRDVPWGSLYDPNFQGRCVRRFAKFGRDVPRWSECMRASGARALPGRGDAAFDWDVLPGLTVRWILWSGDADDGIAPS